ncbi:MAG: chorismate mutase [Rhizobiaceae bacterium]|nr:chorismate mutase [Rhizobiaceae bacterium]
MSEAADDTERARVLLKDLRASIDNIDAAIVYMLAERFRCTEAVSRLKAEHKLPPADPKREQEQITRLRRLAEDARFSPEFVEKFLNFIISNVIRHHEMVAAGRSDVDLVAR